MHRPKVKLRSEYSLVAPGRWIDRERKRRCVGARGGRVVGPRTSDPIITSWRCPRGAICCAPRLRSPRQRARCLSARRSPRPRRRRGNTECALFPGFRIEKVKTSGSEKMHSVIGGSGAPILLLHGAPRSRVSWHAVGRDLARDQHRGLARLRRQQQGRRRPRAQRIFEAHGRRRAGGGDAPLRFRALHRVRPRPVARV